MLNCIQANEFYSVIFRLTLMDNFLKIQRKSREL